MAMQQEALESIRKARQAESKPSVYTLRGKNESLGPSKDLAHEGFGTYEDKFSENPLSECRGSLILPPSLTRFHLVSSFQIVACACLVPVWSDSLPRLSLSISLSLSIVLSLLPSLSPCLPPYSLFPPVSPLHALSPFLSSPTSFDLNIVPTVGELPTRNVIRQEMMQYILPNRTSTRRCVLSKKFFSIGAEFDVTNEVLNGRLNQIQTIK